MDGLASSNGNSGDTSDLQQDEHSAALNAEAFLNSIQDTASGDLSATVAVPSKETISAVSVDAGAATAKKPRGGPPSRPKYNPLGAGTR